MASYRKREKAAFAIITRHITDPDWISELRNTHFQQGLASYNALSQNCAKPANALQMRKLNQQWDELDLLAEVGVNAHSISLMLKRIKKVNSKRPAAHRKTADQLAERLLECIFDTSKHFSENALKEYNAPAGSRNFETNAGGRDLAALSAYYDSQWSAAVESKLPGFAVRDPIRRPTRPSHNTLEAGFLTTEAKGGNTLFSAVAGSNNFYVPSSGSPDRSIFALAEAGHDLANRRGTLTTTDWTLMNTDELQLCVDYSGVEGDGEVAFIADANDQVSVEIICDNCRGIGHLKLK